MTILELWKKSGEKKGLKVRWSDWGHQFRYFMIERLDEKSMHFEGTLDNGEKIKYPANAPHWKIYNRGDEDGARAS